MFTKPYCLRLSNLLYRTSKSCFSTQTAAKSCRPLHPYRDLYPWQTQLDLAKLLVSNVVYNQHGLLALVKPTGLGIHKSAFFSKSLKSDEAHLMRRLAGEPQFSIAEVMDYICQLLSLPRLHIVRSIHRDYSGLVLLSSDPEVDLQLKRAISQAKYSLVPFMRFHVIVQGLLPATPGNEPITERCGIRLTEIDEFGDVKEPVYVPPAQFTKHMKKSGTRLLTPEGRVKPVLVRYQTLATNRELAVSLIQLDANVTKWSFVQCFLAYKAAFVLGDVYFSNRVKHILGKPVAIKPTKVSGRSARVIDPNFEPLSNEVRQVLGVKQNGDMPLMIHHDGLTLPGFEKKFIKKKKIIPNNDAESTVGVGNADNADDLVIRADSLERLPPYFVYTLEQLGLNVFSK